ncbi:centrosomal protein of 295 kDa isoform X2 [Ranitomeya imitator]|uniref:centrosomal protein of 295 kDa isoform X2 n=1 Tax=Ranitomeya imitator TaxID=111125 RepID=UPI0037E9C7D9
MSTDTMKRKVAKLSALRLSPNEEVSIIQQERERRRKLRLQQVREQEKLIAQQIRQDVKERRDQQLQQLAEDLRAKWEAAQAEKLQALEKIYLRTLSAIGEGHRQAKENEPDVKAIEMKNAANKEKAEKRHREALKELKQHKEKQLRAQSWHIRARKKALGIEKERAAKIAGLPPPPPDPLQNLEVAQRLPLVKVCNVENFSTSHYHLPEAYVDREMDTEQTDARSAAVEEEKRLNALQQEEDRERREQMEKAVLRGSHALKMVQLTQDRDRLMKDLEQMQQDDLSRRRQIVAKMPQQLFEPAYRRAEIREDWQRELESAFEDMYTRNAKIRGDMVLQLKPQPLPDPSVTSVDEDLDLTAEPEAVSGVERLSGGTEDVSSVEEQHETGESQSKKVLKRLLNRIRTQKDEWNAKAETSDEASDTLESGSLPIHQEAADVIQEAKHKSAIDSNEVTDNTVLAGKSILLHPQEQAMHIRMEAERNSKMEELERQKREQLELIRKLEDERESLKAEFHRMREGEQRSSVTAKEEEPEPAVVDGKPKESASTVFQLNTSAESLHIQMIREYQQRLIEQNRLHQQSLDDARKRLQEYQLLLKNRYPHLSTSYKESPAQSPTIEKQPQGLVSAQQISPRNGSQTLEPAPSSASDKLRTESPVSVDSSHPHLFGGRSPQGLLSHSPNEARVTVTGSEKLSSASSPGEHDSSSGTSYLPLPRALSLGLPETDFSEPNISFMFPEEQVNRRCPPLLEDFSNVQEFRERLLSSAAEIRNQQDHLKEMQIQLDEQRESLLSKQKSQEQHLLHKQKELEEQIQRHQESLEKLLGPAEPGEGAVPADLTVVPERERYQFMSALLEALDEEEEKEVHSVVTNFESSNGYLLRPAGREQKWRPSKPPVTKTKLGPFLQQHELSAIMEVETPSGSGRRSSTGISELRESQTGRNERSGHGDALQCHPDITRMSSDSTLLQGELSRLSASISDETANQSRGTLSWRETLALEGSHDSAVTDRSVLPVLHEILSSDEDTSSKRLFMEEGASGLGPTGQGRSPTSACDYLSTTTISSGSFLTSERTDTSPVISDLQRCNYSDIEENKDVTSPSTATTWSHYLCPVKSDGHIQQIIEKYTKDLSASLGRNVSFHSPSVATDISSQADHLSDTFHSLDPKLDSDISTPSYARSDATITPQSLPDLSRSSSNSSHREPQPYRSSPSSSGLFHSHVLARRSPRRPAKEDFSGSFLPLHPESTLNEPNLSLRDEPSCVISGQDQVSEDPWRNGALQSFDATRRPFAGERSSTILTSAAEESGSFHELAAAQMTADDSELSEHPVSESLERNSVKSVHFEELPTVPEDQHGEVSAGSEDPKDIDEGSNLTGSLNRTPKSEVLAHTSHSRSALQSLSSLTIGSSAGSLPSFIRTWDSESMRGILEEPDLTLISLNDSSVVSSEPPVSLSADHQGVNTSQSTFQPLQPEVDTSGLHDGADQSTVTMSLSQQFAEMSLEFTSTPGNLQEALMRKKRHFIQNSAQRVREMKKDRSPKEEDQMPDLSHVSDIQGDPQSGSGLVSSIGGQLKKVVEVRVCTPEDRRLSEIAMHQRTIRLYNQLHEVKTQREEKMRQETYAKNREKAREFKKKTLEKLRAKK